MAKKVRRRKKEEEVESTPEGAVEEESQKKKEKRRDRAKDSSVIYKTGEMPRMRAGSGVARKLAIAISAAIAVIMLVFFIVLYIVVSGALDKQIDAGGIVAAKLLAAPDYESWSQFYGLENRTGLTEVERNRSAFNRKRLSTVLQLSSQMLNASIYSRMKDRVMRSAIKADEPPIWKSSQPGPTEGDVEVSYGILEVTKKNYKGRSYWAPIKDYKDELIGYSNVVLSEDSIDDSKVGLTITMLILTVVFIALGVVVAFFMGRKITSPIQSLIEDMTIVAGGDLTHHTTPHSQDEIGLLARTFDKMTKNLHEAQAKEIELAAQRHQMVVAQEVQASLLPTEIHQVPGYEIMACHRSSREVDGNYYDVIQYPDGKLGILVAAASGKGVPAAMVMTMARSFFRALVNQADGPAAMLREANRLLSPDLRAGMYVEVLMVLLDPSSHKVKLVSAGPTSLLRYAFADKKLQGIHAEGIAVGFDKGPVFDKSLKEVEIDVAPGDRLVLNTPALFTIKNPEGVELGTIGFAKAVNKHATKNSDAFVNLVVNILDNYAGKEIDETDITFITVRRKEA
jgi:serine phosphatase RsbU (regulator of sigma subunit)